MRLIDADALPFHNITADNGLELDTFTVVFKRDVDNAPTVERPRGKWIFRSGVTCGGYYKCSNCGEVERAEKNYCPNCGADMRGEE